MSSITPNAKRPEPPNQAAPNTGPPSRPAAGGFWSFLKTLFVGTAGLAILGVVGALAGSAWLTANQRAEAEKSQPWTDPSFTTTAVTTGGLLARWMDSDSNLDNGHTYIQGIYNLWKGRHDIKSPSSVFHRVVSTPQELAVLPPLWQVEFTRDAEAINKAAQEQLDAKARETIQATRQAKLEAERAEAENIRTYKKSLQIRTFEPE